MAQRIAFLDENDFVVGIGICNLGDFPNTIADNGFQVGDLVNPTTGEVITPAPPKQPDKRKVFLPHEFLDEFNNDEIDRFDESQDRDVKKFLRRLTLRKKRKLRVDDPRYISNLEDLFIDGVIDGEKKTALLEGI